MDGLAAPAVVERWSGGWEVRGAKAKEEDREGGAWALED
jgi:hypothetical protein